MDKVQAAMNTEVKSALQSVDGLLAALQEVGYFADRRLATAVFLALRLQRPLLLEGEQIVGAYKTVRDQVVFTSHRIIMVDMQGVTGTRQQLFVLPYRKVLHYGIQTAGFGDPLQASQLTVCFADGHEAKFGFIGQKDLFQVANAISARIL